MKIRYVLLALFLSQTAWAEKEHRDHGTHVHGHVALNMAVSGSELLIELDSPAMNLLGFEHRANSAEDKNTLNQTAEILRNPSGWLQVGPTASCELVTVALEGELLEDGHREESHSKARRDDHEANREDGEEHTGFFVRLKYRCAKPDLLQSINLSRLFEQFKGIEEIEAQWITETQQSAMELDRNNAVISFH